MANGNTLNVEITSSVDGLKKGLAQADKGLKNFDKSVDKTSSKTNRMGKQLSTNAVPALTSFSQVVQDAPFGIQGVANNITQLTAQFGNLSKASGGARAALSGMISSLAGPAGILLAVSVVTSLLVSYGKEIKEFINGTDEAKLSTERLNDALRDQIGIRKALKDELSIATSIAKAEAKLAGKSAEEQFKIGEKFAKARIISLQTQVKEAKKIRLAAAAQARLAKNQENEEIKDLVKKAFKDELSLEKSLRDAQSELRLANLNEQIRIQEQSKKATTTFQGDIISSLKTFKSQVTPIASELNATILNAIPSNEQITLKTAQMQAALIALNQGAKNIIEGELANTFSGIGESIGNAFSEGTDALAAVGSAIVQGLGKLLSAMGVCLIQAGTAAVLAGTITKLFGSIAGVGAGFAAIAGGTILKALGTGISNFGGAVNTDTDFSDGGSSSFTGSQGSFSSGGSVGGGTYVFEIAGTKLIGVLKNTLDRNRALGGSNNLVFG